MSRVDRFCLGFMVAVLFGLAVVLFRKAEALEARLGVVESALFQLQLLELRRQAWADVKPTPTPIPGFCMEEH